MFFASSPLHTSLVGWLRCVALRVVGPCRASQMLGATNPLDAQPGTIRGDFCTNAGRRRAYILLKCQVCDPTAKTLVVSKCENQQHATTTTTKPCRPRAVVLVQQFCSRFFLCFSFFSFYFFTYFLFLGAASCVCVFRTFVATCLGGPGAGLSITTVY